MRQCFECGRQTGARYCEQDGMATFVPDLVPSSSTLRQGQIIGGRYRVERYLARGGVGEVYQAVHVRTGGTMVLKTLLLPGEARRFFQEARTTTGLRPHPNLIQIFDFGQSDDGLFYLAMELLTGESLAQRLDRRERITEAEATEILIQVLEGLEHAHSAGLLHRDLKTDNIFLHGLRPGREIAKILDFGLAKGSGLALTQEGMTMGTPAYMAPERCRGDRTEDPRSDLYSLGVVLFESVSGQLPFAAESPIEMMARQIQEPAPDLAALVPVSAPFAAAVALALRKDPAARFPDARAMRLALEEAHQACLVSGRQRAGTVFTGFVSDQATLVMPHPPLDLPPPAAPPTAPAAPRLPRQAWIVLAGIAAVLALWAGQRAAHRHLDRRAERRCVAGTDPVASCRRACQAGATRSCARLGEALLAAGGPAQKAEALAAYQAACDRGEGPACAALGRRLLDGSDGTREELRGAALLQRACEAGVAAACHQLGELYAAGKVVMEDEARAAAYYGRASAGGHAASFLPLGALYMDGRGVPRDPARAAALFQRACEAGAAIGCYYRGTLYESGKGVARDEAGAARLYQQACDAGEPAGCGRLGALYLSGRGVRRDAVQGLALLRRSCKAGHAWACSYLREVDWW
jgi:serine/threonine-protein kinase